MSRTISLHRATQKSERLATLSVSRNAGSRLSAMLSKIRGHRLAGLRSLFRFAHHVFIGRVADFPAPRHLFSLPDLFERFVEIGRKADRRTDCCFAEKRLSRSAFQIGLS